MSIAISVFLAVIVFGALLYCVKHKKPIIVHCSRCNTPGNYLTGGICQTCAEDEIARGVPLK